MPFILSLTFALTILFVQARLEGNRIMQGPSALSEPVRNLVDYLYSEATTKLSNSLQSPLGTLTLSQVEKGETILVELYQLLQEHRANMPSEIREKMGALTKEFYGAIPQKQQPSIDNLSVLEEKQELVQLLKDMLTVRLHNCIIVSLSLLRLTLTTL